ncbi:MAG: hypothetical protein KY432_03220 [Acidobacteria bacterium]|nr:hypothetical protein [Acidobacteriota bacterium]
MNKRSKILLVSGVVAAIAITGAFLYYPPIEEADARGAIGAVEKHQEQQISDSDVVLGDEQERKQEAALYGDLLADSAHLESFSAELGSFAQNLGSADFDRQAIASFSQRLDSRFDQAANDSLGLVAQLEGRTALQSFSADLASMEQAFENKSNLGLRQLESFEQMVASMAESLEARNALAAKNVLEAQARLEGFSRQYENRQALESRGMALNANDIGNFVSDLEAKQQLEARMLESRMLQAKVQQLQARVLEQKVVMAARNQLEALGSAFEANQLQGRSQLNSFSAELASRASALESRALGNMQARYEMRMLEARMLDNMAVMAASARQQLEGRTNLESRQELENLTEMLGNLSADLENRQPMFAQKFMLGMQAELSAISQHLEAKERLGSRFAMANRQQLENRQTVANRQQLESGYGRQNLEGFSRHLGNLSTSLEGRALIANKQSRMLGAQAQKLQSRTAALQSRMAM